MRVCIPLFIVSCLTLHEADGFVIHPGHASEFKTCTNWSPLQLVAVSPESSTESQTSLFDDACPYKDTFHLNKKLKKLASFRHVEGYDRQSEDAPADDASEVSSNNSPSAASTFSAASAVAMAVACQEEWEKYRNHPRVPSDKFGFNIVLGAWARCSQFLAEHRNQKPTNDAIGTVSFSTNTIYTAQEAAQRALDMLNRLEAEAQNSKNESVDVIVPDIVSYNLCMEAWAKCRRPEALSQVKMLYDRIRKSETLQPTEQTYCAVIEVYADADQSDYLERILRIVEKIESSNDLKPTIKMYNAVLHAYCRAGKPGQLNESEVSPISVAQKCLKILDHVKQMFADKNDVAIRPNIATYNTVIEALSWGRDLDLALKADELLEEMKQAPFLEPVAPTYVGVISAWSRIRHVDALNRVDTLLSEAIESNQVSTKAFTSTMFTWSRSNSPQKLNRCLDLLKQMKAMHSEGNLHVRPDPYAYQVVIEACARANGDAAQQTAAIRIAFAVFKSIQLDPNVQVTSYIFSSLINAVSRLLPAGDERTALAKAVFEKAVVANQLDKRVIQSMRTAVDATTLQSLLADIDSSLAEFEKQGKGATRRKQ